MRRPRRRRHDPDEARAEALWQLEQSMRAHEEASRLAARLRRERHRNHLEELLRRAIGGRTS